MFLRTMTIIVISVLAVAVFQACASSDGASADAAMQSRDPVRIRFGTERVGDLDVFYREAGDPSRPTLVLLHGFPTSSHMYHELMLELGDAYHLIAPDYPGFGESSAPPSTAFHYTFDRLADVIDGFLEQRKIESYALYIQDFGAPVGFRIALRHPERVRGLIVQNGNAFEEGLGEEAWAGLRRYWAERSEANERALDGIFTLDGLKWQYTHGTRDPGAINPDNWNLDFMKFSRPGTKENMLELLHDYRRNLAEYPAWQQWLKENQPPTLVVWGKNDAFFPEPGAAGYRRVLDDVEYHILDTGHFALEEELPFIAARARAFLGRL